jgi:hypothetical protein
MISDNMYALEGYKRVYMPRKGYVDVSTAYPKGVPRSMGRAGGSGVLLARIARGDVTGFSPAEVAYAIELNDPRNTPLGHAIGTSSFRFPGIIPASFTTGSSAQRAALSAAYETRVRGTIPALTAGSIAAARTGALSFGTAATGLAAGGSALARGGPSVGTIPGGGLAGIGESLTSTGAGITNMVKQYIPLATKVILAVIVIKIVLWLVIGRKK